MDYLPNNLIDNLLLRRANNFRFVFITKMYIWIYKQIEVELIQDTPCRFFN